jgi:hypothetical protein
LALRKQLPLHSARLGLAYKAGSANSRLHSSTNNRNHTCVLVKKNRRAIAVGVAEACGNAACAVRCARSAHLWSRWLGGVKSSVCGLRRRRAKHAGAFAGGPVLGVSSGNESYDARRRRECSAPRMSCGVSSGAGGEACGAGKCRWQSMLSLMLLARWPMQRTRFGVVSEALRRAAALHPACWASRAYLPG